MQVLQAIHMQPQQEYDAGMEHNVTFVQLRLWVTSAV